MAKTEIEFVAGFDPACPVPAEVRSAGLDHRFAVIQHSYKPGSVDMVFDESLCRALVVFARHLAPSATILVFDESEDRHAFTLDAYLRKFDETPSQHNGPPYLVLVKEGSTLVACIASEEWAAVGGPEPYHDSYTYSVFAKFDAGSLVVNFLTNHHAAEGWSLASPPIAAPERPRKTLLQRLLNW
jgi:hypothetical protein